MTGDKIRFRFRKADALRLISHLDTMRCFERMLRRADLPFRRTQGFHPYPRLVLCQSLTLGCDGLREVGELELTKERNIPEIEATLNAVAPPGLTLFESRPMPMNATAIARRFTYTATIPIERARPTANRAAELMSESHIWVERIKPRPRGLNIKPYLKSITVVENTVTFDIWVTGGGTARLDELLRLLDIDDVAENLKRTELIVRDESEAEPGEPPLDLPTELRPPAPITEASHRNLDKTPSEPSWGLSPAGPVTE